MIFQIDYTHQKCEDRERINVNTQNILEFPHTLVVVS